MAGINIPDGSSNQFFGQKVSKPGVNVYNASDSDLIYKNDYSTTTYYSNDGSQIQVGNFIDNSTNGVRIYNKSGQLVSQYGQQSDGSTNYKFFDSNGVGLAQFGNFKDGTTALKVAKEDVEVSSATDDQLIFNSNQDVFKIVEIGSIIVPGSTSTLYTGPTSFNYSSPYIYYNFATYSSANSPSVIIQQYNSSTSSYSPVAHHSLDFISFSSTLNYSGYHNFQVTNTYIRYFYQINGYISAGSISQSFGNQSYKIFILQETAN